MRIRWANVLICLAFVAGLVWVLSSRHQVSELPVRTGRLLKIDEEWGPVFGLLGIAIILALAIRLIRESRSGGGG